MKKMKSIAVILSALMLTGCFTGCKDKKNDSSAASSSSASDTGSADASVDITLDDGYTLSEIVVPESGSDESGLGNYRISNSGVKMYYEDGTLPVELLETVEKYFTAIAENDFDTYESLVLPKYFELYENFLKNSEDYGYDMKKSFEIQCENCKTTCGGDFKVSRILVEASEEKITDQYLESIGETIGDGFTDKMKDSADSFDNVVFFVMVSVDGKEDEVMLADEAKMFFGVIDGKYYVIA